MTRLFFAVAFSLLGTTGAVWANDSQCGEGGGCGSVPSDCAPACGAGAAAAAGRSPQVRCASGQRVQNGPFGTILIGEPGPGVRYKDHIKPFARGVSNWNNGVSLTGSRVRGTSIHSGLPFNSCSDLDFAIMPRNPGDFSTAMDGVVDIDAPDFRFKGVENLDHGMMGLADLDDLLHQDPNHPKFGILPRSFPGAPQPPSRGRVVGGNVAGAIAGMGAGLLTEACVDAGLQAAGVDESIAGATAFGAGYVVGTEVGVATTGWVTGSGGFGGSAGFGAIAVAPIATHTYMMTQIAEACNDCSDAISEQTAQPSASLEASRNLDRIAAENLEFTEKVCSYGGIGALQYGAEHYAQQFMNWWYDVP